MAIIWTQFQQSGDVIQKRAITGYRNISSVSNYAQLHLNDHNNYICLDKAMYSARCRNVQSKIQLI